MNFLQVTLAQCKCMKSVMTTMTTNENKHADRANELRQHFRVENFDSDERKSNKSVVTVILTESLALCAHSICVLYAWQRFTRL